MLGLLLLEANRVVPVDRLVDGVWGDDPPASAQASLQNHLVRLRRELGDRLVTRPPGYLLRVAPGELDLDRVPAPRRGGERRRAGRRRRAPARRPRALARARRSPTSRPSLPARAAAHLDELRLSALEDRIDADLALGRHVQLVPELEELVAREPYRERLRRQLIVALYRSGRQADALEAYADARRTLVEELGTEPGRELQELQRAVLRQDPALDAPAGAAPAPARPPTRGVAQDRHGPRRRRRAGRRARRPGSTARGGAASGRAPRSASSTATARASRHSAAARVLGVFGVPAAQDDDSLRAVTAAVALRLVGPRRRGSASRPARS